MAGRLNNTNLLYPPFAQKLIKAVQNARNAGIPVEIFETYRTIERQRHLYAKGRTSAGPKRTNARPGRSWHNYGIAADIVMRDENGYNWDKTNLYVSAAKYFEAQGLYWSGRNQRFVELVHYQLPCSFSIYEVESKRKEKGLMPIWIDLNQRYGEATCLKYLPLS